MGRLTHHLPCWVPSRRLKTSFTTMGLSLMSFGRAWITSFYKGKAGEGRSDTPPACSREASALLALGGEGQALTSPSLPVPSSSPSLWPLKV